MKPNHTDNSTCLSYSSLNTNSSAERSRHRNIKRLHHVVPPRPQGLRLWPIAARARSRTTAPCRAWLNLPTGRWGCVPKCICTNPPIKILHADYTGAKPLPFIQGAAQFPAPCSTPIAVKYCFKNGSLREKPKHTQGSEKLHSLGLLYFLRSLFVLVACAAVAQGKSGIFYKEPRRSFLYGDRLDFGRWYTWTLGNLYAYLSGCSDGPC